MSLITILPNTKGNLACSRSIDPSVGCTNHCVGCYAARVSYKKDFYENVEVREFDEKEFIKSCKKTVKQGYRFIRVGKLCDPFLGETNIANTKRIIENLTKENLRGVFVTKSLTYDKDILKLLKEGKHTLHFSLGMITEAPSDEDRLIVANEYNKNHRTSLRIVGDVTKPIPWYAMSTQHSIITPMRFSSKDIAEQYGADLSKYKFTKGYYKAQEIHASWGKFPHWCGEILDEIRCCGCLVNKGE